MRPDTRTIAECATARQALESLPAVVAVSVLQDDPRFERNVLEVTVGPDYDRVPPAVLRVLAEYDFGVRDTSPRGDPRHYTVVAF